MFRGQLGHIFMFRNHKNCSVIHFCFDRHRRLLLLNLASAKTSPITNNSIEKIARSKYPPMKNEAQPNAGAVMQRMLAENAQAAAKVVEVATQERARAAAELLEAKAEHARTLQAADSIRADFEQSFYAHYKKDFIAAVQDNLVPSMLEKGFAVEEIAQRMEISLDTVKRILNKEKEPVFKRDDVIAGQIAKIWYTSAGRGGDVVLDWGGQTTRFWWEFAGGNAVAIVGIPKAEHWEAKTGIPLAERDAVLQFMGKHITNDQSPGGRFDIEESYITIY